MNDYGIQAAQTDARVTNGYVPAQARPTGSLTVQTARLAEHLNSMESVKNRLWALSERLVNPRPEPAAGPPKVPTVASNSTLEGALVQLGDRAQALMVSLDALADRMDSAL